MGRSGWFHWREGRIGLQCRRYDLKKDIIMTVTMTMIVFETETMTETSTVTVKVTELQ